MPKPSSSSLTADQSTVRNSNLALVASELFTSGGGLSRADLATQTGLTRATTSRLVKDLIDMGILVEEMPVQEAGRGRPGTPLIPSSGKIVGIGVEVNVDHAAGVAIDLSGKEMGRFEVFSNNTDSDPAKVLKVIADETRGLIDRLQSRGVQEVCGIYLAVPGVVDSGTGTVVYAPNLGWRDVCLADYFDSLIGPVEVDNDANLQAVAASVGMTGSLVENQTFFYISGDYGIGGSIVTAGQTTTGMRGWAGEVGHMTIEPGGPGCHCGSDGCLERYAGSQAIRLAADLDENTSPEALIEALEAGEVEVVAAVSRAGWALGIAIANTVKLLDVETIVLGTGLSLLVPWLMPSIRDQLKVRLLGRDVSEIEIVGAPVDEYPAARGGALRALRRRLEMVGV